MDCNLSSYVVHMNKTDNSLIWKTLNYKNKIPLTQLNCFLLKCMEKSTGLEEIIQHLRYVDYSVYIDI